MFIKKIQLQNFKRFTDLTIDLSNENMPPKLVLLIGTNGCGKSSVFDAFEFISKKSKGITKNIETEYYKKSDTTGAMYIALKDFNDNEFIFNSNGLYNFSRELSKNNFYGRSAFRYTPILKKASLGTNNIDITTDTDRPARYIDTDESRFENDIEMELQKMIESIQGIDLDDEKDTEKTSYFDIMHETIRKPINESLSRIFANEGLGIRMVGLTPPGGTKTTDMIFRKGTTKKIRYNYLSAGEKEIINILFDIYVKKDYYNDTIYFLDELDSHLNTSLQYSLIEEIVRILPENCQLRTATHSLGFIDFARNNKESIIIDFNEKNFDLPQILIPTNKGNQDILNIAIPANMINKIFTNKVLIYCENTDDEYYNALGLDNIIFCGDTNRDSIFLRLEQEGSIDIGSNFGLIDRDYLSDNERKILIKKVRGLKILNFYCFENYLYHPDNINEIVANFPKNEYIQSIIKYKNDNLIIFGGKLSRSRQSMVCLKPQKKYFTLESIKKSETIIQEKLKSNDFIEFYPVFSMKEYDKSFLSSYNLDKFTLTNTNWFKDNIKNILAIS